MFVRKAWAVAAAVAVTSWGMAGSARAVTYTLQHTNSIDLSGMFNSGTGYGTGSLSIAFDGTNAYVGGSGAVSTSVGIVQVQNVMGVTPAFNGLAGTQFVTSSNANSRGINALAFDGTYLYSAYDGGLLASSFVKKMDTAGAAVWTVNTPAGVRPFAMAIDPMGDAGSPAVGILVQGTARRLAIKTSDGSTIYNSATGAIITSSPFLGTSFRGLAFDSAGNVATAEDSGVAYGTRVSANQFKDLNNVNDQTTRSVLKSANLNDAGNGVALLEGLAAGSSSSVLVLAPRVSTSGAATSLTVTDATNGTQTVSSGSILLRNPNGTTAGLPQAALVGSEDGIGAAFTTEAKNFAVAKDANGLPILLSVSNTERRLDVYQMEPTYASDADGNWTDTANWLAGVSPDSATLNARFGTTTASRTVTVDQPRTVKMLKFDSANGYTLNYGLTTNNMVTIDAPDGQGGNVQVLQGTHTVGVRLGLNKATTIDVAAGAGLNLTQTVTAAPTVAGVGVTKTGAGTLTLVSDKVELTGPLTVSGGTLDMSGGFLQATRLAGSGTAASPATITVGGNLRVAANGTDAATSVISADTALTIVGNGRIDLNDNDMVWSYAGASPIDTVRGYLHTGRNGGTWGGLGGIYTSAPAANGDAPTGIGYAEATDLGVTTFSGQPTGAAAVVLKYTWYGDVNLDGRINADDYALADRGMARYQSGAIAANAAHWLDGDFDYNGVVDASDYLLMDTAYGVQSGTLSPGLLADRESRFGEAYVSELIAAVPEPASVGVLGIGAVALVARRRRRRA